MLPFRPLCPTGDPHFLFPTLIFYPLSLYCFFAFPSLPETSVNPPGQRSPNFNRVLYFTLVHFKVLYALKCSGALLNSNQLNIQTSGLLFILFLDPKKCFFFFFFFLFFFCPTGGQHTIKKKQQFNLTQNKKMQYKPLYACGFMQ